MAVILGATYPDIFAAIGVHSGAEYRAITSPLSGGDVFLQGGPDPIQQGKEGFAAMGSFARVVPTIVFHGTNDTVSAPINGNQVVQQWMETDFLASQGSYQADFNHPSSTMNGQIPGGHSYAVYSWNDNNGNEVQEYWLINGMGHAWSGGSPGDFTDPAGPNASLAMYTFFIHINQSQRRSELATKMRKAAICVSHSERDASHALMCGQVNFCAPLPAIMPI